MKILQLIPSLRGGGAERFTVDLSNALADEYNLSLLTLYNTTAKDFLRKKLDEGITTYSIGKKRGFDYKIFKKLFNTVKIIKPDVIHSHLLSINYLMVIYPLFKNVPLVYTIHSDAFKDCPNPVIRAFRKQLFRQNSVVPVTISSESKQSFQKAYKNTDSEVIFNGRAYPVKSELYPTVVEEIERLKLNSETKVFVHIGRMTSEKNQNLLVDVFNQIVTRENINAILIILGSGRDKNSSQRIQQKLKEADAKYEHIHVLGERSNATDYLHAADYFCLSSRYEGMPITLIEAFATGCIPICTNVGGMPEMIAGLDPSLIPQSSSAEDYYLLFKKVLKLPETEQKKLRSKAIALFDDKYSIEYSAGKYVDLYRKLVY